MYIVTELCENGTLHDMLVSPERRPKSENDILNVFTNICLGIQHVH